MPQTNIYVGVKDNSTTTTAYPVKKGDHITFHNRGPDVLTVTFTDTPLCDDKVSVNPVIVPKGEQSAALTVCKDHKEGGYPFTNQITGFAAEDPIVIIESNSSPGSIFSLLRDPIVIIEAALVLAALAAGYALGKWRATRKTPASPGRP